MTRAFEAAQGLVTPPPLHRWMEAVLLLCVSLAHSVVTTLGMRRRRQDRDWHTDQTPASLPQAKDDIQSKDQSGTASLRLAVDAQRRTSTRCDAQTLRHQPKSSWALSRGSFLVCRETNRLALVVSRPHSGRPSNDACGLTRDPVAQTASPDPKSSRIAR